MAAGLKYRLLALVTLFSLCAPGFAEAHETRPGFLQITETGPNRYNLLFKVPLWNGARVKMFAVLPETCQPLSQTLSQKVSQSVIERTTIECENGLIGEQIYIQGLEGLITDVLVRIQPMDGYSITRRLKPDAPRFVVPAEPTRWEVTQTYLVLGIEHILGGIDHLLFVLALLLLVKGWRALVKTITAFTVAHSITLAAASLGMITLPGAPVEAVIALSILFLAAEVAHSQAGRPGITERYPWIVAFTFGLLHGFGFAGALSDIGLPPSDIPLALFLFNVGVEVGQLMFVAVMLGLMAVLSRIRLQWPVWIQRIPAYGIGSLAAFWCIQRIASFW